MENITIEPIGVVHNGVAEPTDSGWGEIESIIELEERWAGALDGLEAFSHAIVLTHLHRAADRAVPSRRHPRNRPDMPLLGVLAQRARIRPNHIGVTACEIVAVEGAKLTLRGLDAIDGTPVLDIKPYVPFFDRVESPVVPAWVDSLFADYH